MAQPSYIPTRETDLVTWLTNFQTLIDASPTTYGLTSSDATAIDSYVSPYLLAYATAVNPSTRTPAAIAAKDAARNAALPIVRAYSQQVRNNGGVSDDNKIALGLNVPSGSRTPILVPATQPLIMIVAATPGSFTMRFNDPSAPAAKRSKPFGARAVQLVVSYGTTPSTDPDAGSQIAMVTRQPYVVMFPNGQNGKVATLWARWYGRDSSSPNGAGFGPWSLPVSMTVSF